MGYLDDNGLLHLWNRIKAKLSGKQAKLTGQPGQVVGFDGTGLAYAIRGWSNPNMLINWYFPDPVNQRGKMSYSTAGYTIDMWKANRADYTMEITKNGLKITAGALAGFWFEQIIEFSDQLIGRQVTLSILVGSISDGALRAVIGNVQSANITTSGLLSVTKVFEAGDKVYFYNNSNSIDCTIVAAKLDLGSQQTLAHQDADGNWVLDDPPPNKALELAKCQRYYENLGWVTMAISGTTLDVTVPFKVTKRSKPTATCYSANNVSGKISRYVGNSWEDYDATMSEVGSSLPLNGQRIRATGLPNNAIVRFYIVSDSEL